MSFFSKVKSGLKSVANKVTGGYGEVSLQFDREAYCPGQTVKVQITVRAIEDLKITKISVDLAGLESVSYKNARWQPDVEASCHRTDYTLRRQDEISGALEMSAGDSKVFEHELLLPEDAHPTLRGTHLKHSYTYNVEVDIPWGVDLRASQELQVAPLAGGHPRSEQERQGQTCRAKLTIGRGSVPTGALLSYKLKLFPQEELSLRAVTIGLRSMETLQAVDLSRSHPNQPGQNDEERSEAPVERWQENIEVPGRETQTSVLEAQQRIETQEVITGDFHVPDDWGVSYQRGDFSHQTFFVATVDLGDSTPLEFELPLHILNSECLRFKVGIPSPLPLKDPQLGFVHLRFTGTMQMSRSSEETETTEKLPWGQVHNWVSDEVPSALHRSYKNIVNIYQERNALASAMRERIEDRSEKYGYRVQALEGSLQLDSRLSEVLRQKPELGLPVPATGEFVITLES